MPPSEIHITPIEYIFLAGLLSFTTGVAIFMIKKWASTSDKLRESIDNLTQTMQLFRIEIARDYPTRKEVTESINQTASSLREMVKERCENHEKAYHREETNHE